MPKRLNLVLSFLFFFLTATASAAPQRVKTGIDILFEEGEAAALKGKKIGLITNHTAINRQMRPTHDILRQQEKSYGYKLAALFAPEHGLHGMAYADEEVEDDELPQGIPLYSLHGKTRRPTEKMLDGIDLLIFDIQDIGSRSYTYSSTLYYAMEEAAKRGIEVIVLDRPNPINGITVDGPMLDKEMRSFVGYINVPYCHGMTIGELARYFNGEYRVGCKLKVVPMKGWNRKMNFEETGLPWIPTSPHIPEASTAFYYPATGIMGELAFVNNGIGYTLPFKLVGAPWIDGKLYAKHLNAQKFPGVHFEPFHFRPFYGKYAKEDCQGVLVVITNRQSFKPVTTQYLLLGILKSLYPEKFNEAFSPESRRLEMFHKVNGTKEIYKIMTQNPYFVWTLRGFQEKERDAFRKARRKYLIPAYS